MVLPHSGNWDAAGVWFVDFLGGPFMTVAERLKPESLYRRFLDYRESLGMRVVPLTGGPRPSTEVLRDWLDEAGVTCLLVDRNLGSGGVPVSFFGRTATMPGGGGAAGRPDRLRADPDRLPVHRARLAAGLLAGDPASTGPAGSRTGWAERCSRSPTRSPTGSPAAGGLAHARPHLARRAR